MIQKITLQMQIMRNSLLKMVVDVLLTCRGATVGSAFKIVGGDGADILTGT